jgi:hypothetical protein
VRLHLTKTALKNKNFEKKKGRLILLLSIIFSFRKPAILMNGYKNEIII